MTDEQKQREKEEALQRRKEALEAELDSYARAGAFSPGLIKFTRWLSRGLYLAMGVGFMLMLFSGWGKISQEKYDEAMNGYTKWKQEAEKEKTARTEAQDALVQAEVKAAKLKLELEQSQANSEIAVADEALKQARAMITATGDKPGADKLDAAYRAAPDDNRLGLLALFAECAGTDPGGLMRMVATSQRPLAEKIIAVRWMGANKDESNSALLNSLSEGNDTLAAEAKAALKQLGG